MNVEEARAEFILTMEDACIESCEHDSKDGWEHNITIAADAYAMAVLEEAALLGGDHGVELTNEYWAIRRQIEEPGK